MRNGGDMDLVLLLIDKLPISDVDKTALTVALGAFWIMEMGQLIVWMVMN
jgi:hypothetical protein